MSNRTKLNSKQIIALPGLLPAQLGLLFAKPRWWELAIFVTESWDIIGKHHRVMNACYRKQFRLDKMRFVNPHRIRAVWEGLMMWALELRRSSRKNYRPSEPCHWNLVVRWNGYIGLNVHYPIAKDRRSNRTQLINARWRHSPPSEKKTGQ